MLYTAVMAVCIQMTWAPAQKPVETRGDVARGQERLNEGLPPIESTPDQKTIFLPSQRYDVPSWLKLERDWNHGPQCGPNSLYALLNLAGHPVTLTEVGAQISVDARRGASLADLQRASEALGMRCEVRRVNVVELFELPTPFIMHTAHIEGEAEMGHFLTVFRNVRTEGKLGIIDGTSGTYYFGDPSPLARSFDGYVMLPTNTSSVWKQSVLCFAVYLVAAADFALAAYLSVVTLRGRR